MDIDYRAVTVEICSISAVTPPLHLRGITASFTCITAGFPRLPRYYRHPHYRAGLYRLVGHAHSLAHVTSTYFVPIGYKHSELGQTAVQFANGS